ncbi:MAG: malate:quinone oxidoreductase [Sphingobacteriales bacterium]|nr:MAG: malate:quinone oxidoreductase [Sphingobacteriales bacterium]
MSKNKEEKPVDVVLIGAGIMSATLGLILKELQPDITIAIYERLDVVAGESSDAWNNAGTGHSAFCELNYTPEREDGTIEISKAIKIAEQFEVSKEFWSYIVKQGYVDKPQTFISKVPHISFVWGQDNVEYLRKRHDALDDCHLFSDMQFTDNPERIAEWTPLVMEGRDRSQPVAATCMGIGTDVNFGSLTRCMIKHLAKQEGVTLHLHNEIKELFQHKSGEWHIEVKDLHTKERSTIHAGFVFIGAGGGALTLLERSGIPEAKGYGGFPVSGQWLVCKNPDIVSRHQSKVYGKASVGAPPMSVPHLDTRIINGKKALLFGPYAGFSTKFLKQGSYMDLPLSISLHNIRPMLSAGIRNMQLTKYLIDQVMQSREERLDALQDYLPNARMDDWELEVAGQRVQVIKKDEKEGGILQFGTEVVSAADGSISALLGASPGASVSVSIMLELMGRCFPDKMNSASWQDKIRQMIPSYGQSLADNRELLENTRNHTSEVLGL